MVGRWSAVHDGQLGAQGNAHAMWVESPLMEPSIAHTLSSYSILTISLLDAPHVAAIVCDLEMERLAAVPPRALALVNRHLRAIEHGRA